MKPLDHVNKIARKEVVKSHLIKILGAFQRMDYHALNDLLDDHCYYQDLKKPAFILKQKEIFGYLKKQGDTFLEF
jgi:hypothetical protein